MQKTFSKHHNSIGFREGETLERFLPMKQSIVFCGKCGRYNRYNKICKLTGNTTTPQTKACKNSISNNDARRAY